MFGSIAADARYGVRTLLKSPGFTLAAVLALGLGIGANTAIFSVVDAVLMRPLPWKDSPRLVRIWESAPKLGWPRFSTSIPNFIDWRAQCDAFDGLAAWRYWSVNVVGGSGAQRVTGGQVTANFLPLLGITPAMGRGFLPSEETPGNDDHVVILGHSFWKEHFGADPEILSRKLTLSGEPYTVVGVLPERSEWVIRNDMLVPLVLDPAVSRGNKVLLTFGRLKPGVTLDQARASMTAVAARIEKEYPESNDAWGVQLASFYDWIINPDVRRGITILFAAVGFVLLIACANVTNLLLARAVGRSREIAIRAALGAGRLRVVRQLLVESFLLAFAGGAVGVLLALWTVDLLPPARSRDGPAPRRGGDRPARARLHGPSGPAHERALRPLPGPAGLAPGRERGPQGVGTRDGGKRPAARPRRTRRRRGRAVPHPPRRRGAPAAQLLGRAADRYGLHDLRAGDDANEPPRVQVSRQCAPCRVLRAALRAPARDAGDRERGHHERGPLQRLEHRARDGDRGAPAVPDGEDLRGLASREQRLLAHHADPACLGTRLHGERR